MLKNPLRKKQEKAIRVRMAPSPTGALHVGTVRTALFNYLYAKKYGGVFIMRIEDTDIERSKKQWEKNILEGLRWIGLEWDEGPAPQGGEFSISNFQFSNKHTVQNEEGTHGPYRQSERGEIYRQYTRSLLNEGKAFYCWHTAEQLEKEKLAQTEKKEAPQHTCEYRDRHGMGEHAQERSVIRLKNDAKEKITFTDELRGEVTFDPALFGDFSIAKNTETPLYNLAVVIDDYEMKISHVIRGEDHISNTPKQLLLQAALGFPKVSYVHLALVLGSDRSKLSKRHGPTDLSEYRDMGYLPEALFNFLALLGWNPGDEQEVMTKEEIITKFSTEGLQQAGAVFDIEKLNWMNGEYLRKMELSKLAELCVSYLVEARLLEKKANGKWQIANEEEVDFEWLKKVISLEQERMRKLSDVIELASFFFADSLEYDPELLVWKKSDMHELKHMLPDIEKLLTKIDEKNWTKDGLEQLIMPEAEKLGDRGRMLWPLRVALTGRRASPGPFEVMEILGKEKSLRRVQEAMKKLTI